MMTILSQPQCVNTLRPEQNGRHFAYRNFQCISLHESDLILNYTAFNDGHLT